MAGTVPLRMVRRQPWWCEQCGNRGAVNYRSFGKGADDSVYAVRNRIESAHAKADETCAETYGLIYVRVAGFDA